MKIKVITTFLLFCLIAGICYYISLPDYHVRNSMSFSNQGTRDTELTVIVYKYWGIDETIRKIETEHNKINGTPTTLEINLHHLRKQISFYLYLIYKTTSSEKSE